MSLEKLKERAKVIWYKTDRGHTKLTREERATMLEAYWAGALPKDPDYDVGQWVEDGCPVSFG